MAERKSNIRLTKYTPYLGLTGELGVSFVRILKKIDFIIRALHRTHNWCLITYLLVLSCCKICVLDIDKLVDSHKIVRSNYSIS